MPKTKIPADVARTPSDLNCAARKLARFLRENGKHTVANIFENEVNAAIEEYKDTVAQLQKEG